VKAHEFRRFATLPRLASQTFEIALDIHPADHQDRHLLEHLGWRLSDPRVVAGHPSTFRDFVWRSGAEFSAAQGIYTATNSGWFSDRSVRYLASGKPVLVQDTGFRRNLPTGRGLLAFNTLEEAVAGAVSIRDRYEEHSAAARRIAESDFDSDRVLARVLEEVGVGA
jgi:glycosyltransferase involved in cell wall biosynthesis